jgi:Uma2 family endonuclease
MVLHVALLRPAEVIVRNGRAFSDKEYVKFCEVNPDLRVERNAEGEIIIVPPAGFESDDRNTEVVAQLRIWAKKDGRGNASGPTAQFFLADGSALSPDAAWVSNESRRRMSERERKGFPYLCPEFVIEVLSPSDRLKAAKAKMERWIANGAKLAWLIDGDAETVYIYQPNQPSETQRGILKLAGKGPVKGFTLQLRTIWDGLK